MNLDRKKKIAVIGGGISGVSIALMLKGMAEVTVFERKADIGGLIHCERVENILYHKVGGHVFNSKNPQVTDWFWSFFDKDREFIKAKRLAKVLFDNKLVGYPIEDHLFQLSEEITVNAINELLYVREQEIPENFEAFLKNSFGETLYHAYFKPYNKKIWNVDLSEVPLNWLEGKLPMPKVREIMVNNILRKEESNMVHAFFYYPKNGGSQFIIDRLAKNISVNTGADISSINLADGGKIYVGGAGPFDQLIYTGDVRKLPDMLDAEIGHLPNESKLQALKSNGTTNILCRCDINDLSWLYIPEEKYKAHRIIYTGNFADTNNDGTGRSSCTVEFSNYISLEEAKEELKKLPGNLELVSYNHEPNSYVIQEKDTRDLINSAKAHLKNHNIFLLGRFAEWEYNNMDKCIEAAMHLEDELMKLI